MHHIAGKLLRAPLLFLACDGACHAGRLHDERTLQTVISGIDLVCARVNLQRSIVVSKLSDLLQIDGKKKLDRAKHFVLVHVAELVTEQPWARIVPFACKHGVPERKPDHPWTEQACLDCKGAKLVVVR